MRRVLVFAVAVLFVYSAFGYDDYYYDDLYKKASEAIEKGNEQDADFYLARYLGASLLDEETGRSMPDLYALFDSHSVSNPTAFISGRYSPGFIEWFMFASHAQWGGKEEDVNLKTLSFVIVSGSSNYYTAAVVGSPFLEGWSIIKGNDTKTAVLALVDYKQSPQIILSRHENGRPIAAFNPVGLDIDKYNIQFIWPPEFHDLDGDGKDELWLRYNKAWASGFSQELAIYRIKDNSLELIKKFQGLSEGIARRLDGSRIEVGEGCAGREGLGHLEYDQTRIEVFEYKDGEFIKVSQNNIPHILWSDEWQNYYFD